MVSRTTTFSAAFGLFQKAELRAVVTTWWQSWHGTDTTAPQSNSREATLLRLRSAGLSIQNLATRAGTPLLRQKGQKEVVEQVRAVGEQFAPCCRKRLQEELVQHLQ